MVIMDKKDWDSIKKQAEITGKDLVVQVAVNKMVLEMCDSELSKFPNAE